jgi:RND family efflux transporter MFP subunit
MKAEKIDYQTNIEQQIQQNSEIEVQENLSKENAGKPLNRPKPRKVNWLIPLLAGILVVGGLGWVALMRPSKQQSPEKADTTALRAKLPVRVVRTRTEPIQNFVSSDGFVSAVRGKHLTFEVPGTITHIKKVNGRELREGDFVRGGELLAQVDDRKLVADIAQANAGRIEAETQRLAAVANLEEAKAQLEQAKANLRKAQSEREFAKTDLRRYQELFEAGVKSASDRDVRQSSFQNADAGVAAAQAQVKAAEDRVKATQAQVVTAESGIDSASARFDRANVTLEDTIIKAPFDGQIAHLNIREGDYWTPQRIQIGNSYQTVVDSVPIILIDPKEFEVIVELPAFNGTLVRPGQSAYIVLDQDLSAASVSGMTQAELFRLARSRGSVFSVSPSVTPGGRAVEAKVRIKEGAKNLRNGARVSVWIAVEENQNALVAPLNAFVFRDQKPHVFVVNPQKRIVEQRQIEMGIEGISMREIRSGVKPGELLVTDGQNRLVNGTPVEIVKILKEMGK